MNAKHTPGPWFTRKWPGADADQSVSAVTEKHKNPVYVARVYGQGVLYKNTETTDANAALIAAAPEMLEALETLLGELDDIYIFDDSETWDAVKDHARAAIAKAKGE